MEPLVVSVSWGGPNARRSENRIICAASTKLRCSAPATRTRAGSTNEWGGGLDTSVSSVPPGGCSPLAIVTSGRWDAALFTTYALSLSFFETYLVRNGLKKAGCEEIWVVADQANYAQALVERQAKGVGQDYRVVPVALPHGVFHPKVVYLHSKEFDAILVGSGNLTFGGFGKNVEVMELFRSDQNPEIFAQFAEFLDALRKRSDFLNPDLGWIERFNELAKHAGANAVDAPGNIRLLHCVEHSVAAQLGAIAQSHGGASSLRILSPFYDEDGSGFATLAKHSGAIRAQIGLLAGQRDTSPFPFGKKFPELKVSAAEVEVPDHHRSLHAKWIECDLNDGNRLVATGSVNATRQSLATTQNIEVDVLRIESQNALSRLKWKKIPSPAHQTISKFIAPGIGSRVLVYASLTEAGRIHGMVLAAMNTEGKWQASLSRPDGHSVAFEIEVMHDGRFQIRVPQRELFECQSALQLALVCGVRRGCCWINNEWLLELAKVKNIPLGSIQRFLQGESDEEDDLAFLEFLTAKLRDVIPIHIGVSPSGDRESLPEPNDDGTIAVDALAPSEACDEKSFSAASSRRTNQLGRLVGRLFSHIEEKLEHVPFRSKVGRPSEANREEEDDDDDDDDEIEEERLYRRQIGVEQFRQAVRTLLAAGSENTRRTAAHWWLLAELHHHLQHDDDPTRAQAFCREWLLSVASSFQLQNPADKFDRVIVTIASILGANAIRPNDLPERLVGLHEALEVCGGTRFPSGQLRDLIDPAWFGDVGEIGGQSRAAGLDAVLGSRTRRTELEQLKVALQARAPLPKGLALLSTGIGEQLRRSFERGETIRLIEFRPDRTSCPNVSCGMALNSATLSQLEHLHITQCVQCGSYIVKL